MFEPAKPITPNVFLGYTERYRTRIWRDLWSVHHVLLLILLAATLVGSVSNWRLGAGSFSYFLLLFGYSRRKTLPVHVPMMVSGIGIDLCLIVFLVITRNALGSAIHEPLNAMQLTHVIASSMAALIYFPLLVIGFMRLNFKCGENLAKAHRLLGNGAMALRTVGYFLMFSMPSL